MSESQTRWRAERIAAGRCADCARLRDPRSKRYCAIHAAQRRMDTRKRQKSKPYKPGGLGRPPVISVFESTETIQTDTVPVLFIGEILTTEGAGT